MWNFSNLWKKDIKVICFDLDNTLYDYSIAEAETEVHISEIILKGLKTRKISIKDVLRIFTETKKNHMHQEPEPEKFARALWIKETLDRINSDYGIKISVLMKKIEKLEIEYWKFLNPRIKIFPNTLKTLADLKSLGYKIATITDSDGKKEFKINRMKAVGIHDYFDYIITTDDTGINKPAIENFEYLLKQSGVSGKNCVMIGDHPEVDLINAKKLGFTTIWTKEHIPVGVHYKFVDYEITDIGQTIDMIKRISKN